MLEIFKKLRGAKANNSEELRKALAHVDVAALEAEVEAADKARREALFVSEAAAEEAEARYTKAVRDLERGKIMHDELTARLQQAEAREADAALTRERAEVEAFAAETAAAIAKRWPGLQREMVELLARLSAAEARVREVNERLGNAGRTDMVAPVEFGRARPRPEVVWEGGISLAATVVLPPIPEWGVDGHGEVKTLPAFYTRPSTAGEYTHDHDRPRPLVFGG